jgi:hypothetical protein
MLIRVRRDHWLDESDNGGWVHLVDIGGSRFRRVPWGEYRLCLPNIAERPAALVSIPISQCGWTSPPSGSRYRDGI